MRPGAGHACCVRADIAAARAASPACARAPRLRGDISRAVVPPVAAPHRRRTGDGSGFGTSGEPYGRHTYFRYCIGLCNLYCLDCIRQSHGWPPLSKLQQSKGRAVGAPARS